MQKGQKNVLETNFFFLSSTRFLEHISIFLIFLKNFLKS